MVGFLPTAVYSKAVAKANTAVEVLEQAVNDQTPLTFVDNKVVLKGFLTKTEEYPIDLKTVLQLVDQQNLTLAQSRMGKKVQSARFYQSLSEFLPDFYGQYDQSRFNGVVQIFGNETVKIYQTRIEPQMGVTYRVYPGGKTLFDALSSRRQVNASESLVKQTFQQQLSTATQAYYDFLEAQMKLDFVQVGLDEAKEQMKVDESRYRVGIGTKLQVMQAKTQVAQRTRESILAKGAVEKAQQALLNTLNLDVSVSLTPNPLDAVPQRLIDTDTPVKKLILNAVINHPTVQRLQKEEKALRWQSRSVVSELVPYVDLNAYISYRGPAFDRLGLNRFGGLTARTQFGENSGLSIPLRWLEQHRLIKQKQLETKAAVRQIEQDVVNAHMDSIAEESAVEASRNERDAANEAYRLSKGRYKAGVGILLDVLNAQAALNQSRSNLVQSVMAFNKAQVRLLEAVGVASETTITTGLDTALLEGNHDD